MPRIVVAVALAAASLAAGPRLAWSPARVVYLRYTLESASAGLGSADSGHRGSFGLVQVARGEIDLEAAGAFYTASETVAPNLRLALEPGDAVQFALDGRKALVLRLPNGKTRKLKLEKTYAKPDRAR